MTAAASIAFDGGTAHTICELEPRCRWDLSAMYDLEKEPGRVLAGATAMRAYGVPTGIRPAADREELERYSRAEFFKNGEHMHRIAHVAIGFVVAATLARPCGAAVVDQVQNGFAIQQKLHIAAPTDKVYAALIAPEKWWSSDHTFSHSAANLALDARAGGCFCETLPRGGSVMHATVAIAMPGALLRLRGPLGPFQGQGVDAALTFTLNAAGDGTDLTLDNVVGGYMKGGFGNWPTAADDMLAATIARLKAYVETGSPDPKP